MHVSKGSNTRCSAPRAWAHTIDDGVLSVTPNHFDEVNRTDAPLKRGATLPEDIFEAMP